MVLRPRVFVSYSRKNDDFVRTLRTDLFSSDIDCWIDVADIAAGERLNPAIEAAISGTNLFFAYVTRDYLRSRWCMAEMRYALSVPGIALAPYVDSQETLDAVPSEFLDELAFGTLRADNYLRSLLEISGRAWACLQATRKLVPGDGHILAVPGIADSPGYTRADLMDRAREEIIIAGPNLRSWLSDEASKRGLVELVKHRQIRVTLILATYETLSPVSAEGAIHLRESARDIREMMGQLDGLAERRLMTAHFHLGASTLSAVFVDPRAADGILFFNPRWAVQFLPQNRLTCVIDKKVNSPDLFKAIYNGVLLMTQGDAKTVDDMLAARR